MELERDGNVPRLLERIPTERLYASNWIAFLTAALRPVAPPPAISGIYVNEALAGRGERLKGYNVGLEVFDRPETFDPAVDPIVRIEAARVREKLREYYESRGAERSRSHRPAKGHLYAAHRVSPSGITTVAQVALDATTSDRPLDPAQGSVHPSSVLPRLPSESYWSPYCGYCCCLLVSLAWSWWAHSRHCLRKRPLRSCRSKILETIPMGSLCRRDHRGHRHRSVALEGPVCRRPKFDRNLSEASLPT